MAFQVAIFINFAFKQIVNSIVVGLTVSCEIFDTDFRLELKDFAINGLIRFS